MTSEIVIARDFTPFPGGRYRQHGEGSGEEFRDDLLRPALNREASVTVRLDGTSGYPSSFLEEAFGGLIRVGFTAEDLRKRLKIEAEPAYRSYRQLAWQFIDDAQAIASRTAAAS